MIRKFSCKFTFLIIAQQLVAGVCFLQSLKRNGGFQIAPSTSSTSFQQNANVAILTRLYGEITTPSSSLLILGMSSEKDGEVINGNSEKSRRSIGRVGGRKPKLFRTSPSKNFKNKNDDKFLLKNWIPIILLVWIIKSLLFSGASSSYYYYYESSSVYETTENNQNIIRREENVRTNIPTLSKPKSSITSIPNSDVLIINDIQLSQPYRTTIITDDIF